MTDVATRRGRGATADVQDVADVADENGAAPKRERKGKPIQINVPVDLKSQIDAAAEAAGKTNARFVLEALVESRFPDYTLPSIVRTGSAARAPALFPKSLSQEQMKERKDNARLLLDALAKGAINLDAVKAQMGLT